MFIDDPAIDSPARTTAARFGLAGVACVLALAVVLAGCGGDTAACGDGVCGSSETADGCAEDCGCGNGVVNAAETCDGTDLAGATCESAAQRGGTLACTSTCTFDLSGCTLASCGNGMIEADELCDGADLGSGTCDALGYTAGTIACSVDCAYDVAGCCNDTCLVDGATTCVGDNLRVCAVQASGCLGWTVTDCAATNDVCDDTAGAAACVCVDRCATSGETRCEGALIETCALGTDGCLDWTETTNCATADQICATAPSGPVCVTDASAENCADPYPLAPGDNVVAWTAIDADYLTSLPSCNTSAMAGPDLVLSYEAPEDGFISFTMNKPASARQVVVVSSAACGMVTPELACLSDSTPTTLTGALGVSAGTTYYFYVRDTTSGTATLDNPLFVTLDESLCSSIVVTTTNLAPANGSSVPDVTPILSVDFSHPVDPSAGVITVTGDLGTALSYDLSTSPPQISLTNGGTTLVIDAGMAFPAGETLTVAWSGLADATCGTTIAPPAWTFQLTGPPCTPGVGGMVGDTVTRMPTGITSITEYYMAVDTDPAGYVYVGGTTSLYRTPKAGGPTEDVALSAGLTSSHLGYDMLINGDDIFTLESNTTATSNVLWRISTDGGATWPVQNYMQLPQPPNDDLRAITHHEGRFYMTTDEFTGAEIWSVAADATGLPAPAVLEATLTGEYYCDGVAVDDQYYYLTCSNADRLIRVDRTTLVVELITDQIDINSTKDALHAHDLDGDGLADALYVSSTYEEVHYICDPGGAGPFFVDVLAGFGSSSSNYGLAFDPVSSTLWMFDDDTREMIRIE